MSTTARFFVRPGVPDDAFAVAEIHVAAWKRAYRGLISDAELDRLSVTERARGWRDRLSIGHGPDYFVVVAEAIDDGAVWGFATAGGTRDDDRKGGGEVYALYVHPDRQRAGAGALLLAEALHRLREASFAGASLWTLERNMGARAFYDAEGWSPDGSRRAYRDDAEPLFEVRYAHELG